MPVLQPPRQAMYRPVSCSECRRLKLRCDRVFPCSSCQKRGCAAICPDGDKRSRKNNRNDESTTTPTEPLIARIRDLEHALATLQATYSNTPHPLLRKELRDSTAQAVPAQPPALDPPADEVDHLSENLGTLSMIGYGKSRFFGTTGGAWRHIWKISEEDDTYENSENADPDMASLPLPPEVIHLASAFPFPKPSAAASHIGNWIVDNLPPSMEAWSLCETFFENGAYIFTPLPRSMFIEQVFSFFYRSNHKSSVDIPRGHRLALLLMVFAIGDMLDLTKPAMPTGGKRFYYLARAALCLESLYDRPTFTAVQTILLMLVYLSCSDHKESAEVVYVLSGINLKLALMLGLHREPLKFNTNQPISDTEPATHVPGPCETELRRVLFLEVIHFEVWQSLQFGRPSQLHFEHFDCMSPGLGPERNNALENNHVKSQAWSYGFIRTCLVPVLNYAVAIKPPSYSDVMKLDATIRAHSIPQNMQICFYEGDGPNLSDGLSRAAVMLRFATYSMREIALLYVHRPYFACAMMDFAEDPLGSPFAPSVLASFRSACAIISKISLLFEKEPALSIRIWIFWSQLLVPCLVLGTIATQSPTCSLASTALTELNAACELLEKAKEGVRASILLPLALKLRAKAQSAFDLCYSAPGAIRPAPVDISAELTALAGKSRVSSPAASAASSASPGSQRSAGSSPAAQGEPPVVTAAPVTGGSSHPEVDWSTFADLMGPPTSYGLESNGQPEVTPSQYDFNAMTGVPALGADSLDTWTSGDQALFGQTGDSSLLQDPYEYPPLDLQPTWQHFLTQMGF